MLPHAPRTLAPNAPRQAAARPVLVVDDDVSVRSMLRTLIERWGYSCEEAENGAQAMQYLADHEVALVLTDCDMPRVDGLTLLRQLAQRAKASAGCRPPAILMSGDLTPDRAAAARAAGAAAVFAKPIDFRRLRAALDWTAAPSAAFTPQPA
jgi:CheY-like chemotaxis protein